MSEKTSKIICPSCGVENLPGTLFCVQCGIYLPFGGPLRTEPLQESGSGRRVQGGERKSDSPAGKAISLEVEILDTGRKLWLSADREILLGRLDAAHGIFPELDISVDGGLEHGVSRRHARIYSKDGVCFVEDLDSTNGTLLNSERLTPYLPYMLHHEDMLTLGTMRLKIYVYTGGKPSSVD